MSFASAFPGLRECAWSLVLGLHIIYRCDSALLEQLITDWNTRMANGPIRPALHLLNHSDLGLLEDFRQIERVLARDALWLHPFMHARFLMKNARAKRVPGRENEAVPAERAGNKRCHSSCAAALPAEGGARKKI